MSSLTLSSTVTPAASKFYTSIYTLTQIRHASNNTYRRHRHRSNIKPDPSFLPSKTELYDHVIHNPPPSMPNIYHTPSLFLPPSDPRKDLPNPHHYNPPEPRKYINSAGQTVTGRTVLPPPINKPYEKKYHLKEEDLEEMRRLRAEDPMLWSCKKLAQKFETSTMFVTQVTAGTKGVREKQEMQAKLLEFVQSRWGPKRRLAREDRQLRREKWYRDA